MRILYITPFFQHPAVPGPTRCYHFIRELSKRHTITLLTLNKSPVDPQAVKDMAAYTERTIIFDGFKNVSRHPQRKQHLLAELIKRQKRMQIIRNAVSEMKQAFLQLVHEAAFDVVIFHGKSVFSVIKDWNDLPLVVDFCDATSQRIKNQMRYDRFIKLPVLLFNYFRMRRIEKELIGKTPHLAFITNRDRDAILGRGSQAQVLPLGMDLDYWTRRTRNTESRCILYTGGMDYRPNVDGAFFLINKILPIVRQSVSNLNVFIVGRNPSPALMNTAERYPDVTVTGFVEDMRPYFEQATVYAAPLRIASGLQNKLLEALAMEVPSVTTPIAAAGLLVDGARPPLLVADGKKPFADSIVRLLNSKNERASLAAAGRQFIEKHFVWTRNAAILENMCLDAVAAQTHERVGSR
jgi:glycosyltransferase involved in cell wall biosynthesis